jgi:hypothetical protein
MPKNRLLIRSRDVTLTIGAPIATAGYGLHSKEELMDEVGNALRRLLTTV